MAALIREASVDLAPLLSLTAVWATPVAAVADYGPIRQDAQIHAPPGTTKVGSPDTSARARRAEWTGLGSSGVWIQFLPASGARDRSSRLGA